LPLLPKAASFKPLVGPAYAPRVGPAYALTSKRSARRFQVEALEGRWTPGGLSGGAVIPSGAACHIGEEIPQVQVSPVSPLGGPSGGVLGDAEPGIGEEIPQRA
jgi:hypothetical protein